MLEVVVATTLLGMVGLLIAMSAGSFQRSWERGQRAAKQLERDLAMDRIAETLLRSMVDFRWPNKETSTNDLVFSGESDELYLTALNRSYGGKSAFRFARLYLNGDTFCCDYSDTPLLPWLELKDQSFITEKIVSGVSSVTFKYATEDENGELTWADQWDTDENDTLPLAIQMTIEYQDGTRQRWLRRRAGTGYNTELLAGQQSS